MGKLYQIFSGELLKKGFGKLGLQLEAVYPDHCLLHEHIKSRKWILSEGDGYMVINSLSTNDSIARSYWEEWYLLDGQSPIHHVLFPVVSLDCQSTYTPPEDYDGIHPNEVFGRTWYVREVSSMVAWHILSTMEVRSKNSGFDLIAPP